MTGKSGRRPADRSNPGRQQIWEQVRQQAGVFTVSDIEDATGADRKTIRDYLACLAAGEYVQHSPAPHGQQASYKLIKNTGFHAPRLRRDGTPVVQGQATEQLWRGMYMLKTFTFQDLIETASIQIPEGTVKAYCKMLLATGYLKVVKKASPKDGRIAKYRLVRNDGPKPPQIQRVKQVYDPNTDTVYQPEATE